MIALLAAAASFLAAQSGPYRYATPDQFQNVEVALTLLHGAAAPAGPGLRLELRRRAASYLYEVGLEDGRVAIRKELPGGPTGAVFYDLAPSAPYVPFGTQDRVTATLVDQADGSVRITVSAQGRLLLSAIDDGSVAGPAIHGSGSVGLDTDGQDPPFQDLAITGLLGASPAPLDAASDSAAKAPQKFLSPALADGINDAAFFGPAAAHVTIFDLRGRRIYETSGPGGLHWDGRDLNGRLVSSGVYVARIRKTDGRDCYQSFAVVK